MNLQKNLEKKVEGLWSIKSFCKETFFSKAFFKNQRVGLVQKNRLSKLNQGAEDFMSFMYELTPVLVLGYGGVI